MKHVLIVDDDPDHAHFVAEVARRMGLTTVVAHSGEAAVNSARLASFDLALLDLQMPGMDGVETLGHLRSLGFTGTAVAVTGASWGEAIFQAAQRQFDRILLKPLTLTALGGALARSREG